MARRRYGLEGELAEAGFSSRTINALKYGLQLESIDQLKSAEWGSVKERTGLAGALSVLPNMGRKGFAEVQAFREHGDARRAATIAPTSVSARLDPPEIAKLDAWAAERGISRTEAVRRIVLSTLLRGD